MLRRVCNLLVVLKHTVLTCHLRFIKQTATDRSKREGLIANIVNRKRKSRASFGRPGKPISYDTNGRRSKQDLFLVTNGGQPLHEQDI